VAGAARPLVVKVRASGRRVRLLGSVALGLAPYRLVERLPLDLEAPMSEPKIRELRVTDIRCSCGAGPGELCITRHA
jgi:hypothetical protein